MSKHLHWSELDPENFALKDCVVAGIPCVLITPHNITSKWTRDTLCFRSSLWTKDDEMKPVSLGFPKFFNYGEQLELYPDPTDKDMPGASLIEKIDGSLLAVSRYQGQLIHRTRGTVDATFLETGDEIELLKKKYPAVFSPPYGYTYIYEWVTPRNRIVLNYPDLDIYCIGCVNHDNYRLASQNELDRIANVLGVKRPKRYEFKTMEEMITTVRALKGVEGLVIYYQDDQKLKKLKAEAYLAAHAFKSEVTIEKMADLYCSLDMPGYQATLDFLQKTYDFETVQLASKLLSKIATAGKEVYIIVAAMQAFADKLKAKPRKEAAQEILKAYGQTSRSSFVFSLLDGKKLDRSQLKKLVYQCLKNA